jgi:triosephosphate isomerase
MRTPFVCGNWKMHGTRESVQSLLDGMRAGIDSVQSTEVAICAPFVFLGDVATQLSGTRIGWGAQNVSHEAQGAFTGEISTGMLADFGCKYVIVGHSERRALYGEDDQMVAAKYAAVRNAGMTPILCVGETLEEREGNITEQVVARQLQAVLDLEGVDALAAGVVAYEPVWAIGTGKTASPDQAQDVHRFIRELVAGESQKVAEGLQILYGGSVKGSNATELFAMDDIDGGLIGGASLSADEFLTICRAGG